MFFVVSFLSEENVVLKFLAAAHMSGYCTSDTADVTFTDEVAMPFIFLYCHRFSYLKKVNDCALAFLALSEKIKRKYFAVWCVQRPYLPCFDHWNQTS